MKFYFLGLLLGILLSFYPFFLKERSLSLMPEWMGNLDSTDNILISKNPELIGKNTIPIKEDHRLTLFNENGNVRKKVDFAESELLSSSGKGDFFVKYSKTGTDVEMFGLSGDKFWKITSNRYPKMSFNGNLIFLFVSDLSSITIIDKNAAPAGAAEITGRFETSDYFPEGTDASAYGFLDGTYYFLGSRGEVLLSGKTDEKAPVKSIAFSENLKYGAVHYGDTSKDSISFIDIEKNKKESFQLKQYHVSKTALFVTNEGMIYVISGSYVYMSEKGDDPKLIEIAPQYVGYSKISRKNNWMALTYRSEKNSILMINNDNEVVLKKAFSEEPSLDCFVTDKIILVRGMKNLYCWSYQ